MNEPAPISSLRKAPRIPQAPKGLRAAGRQLWRQVWAQYKLDEVESGRLARICQLADLRQALIDAGATESAPEIRRLTVEVDRLLVRLGVGNEDDQTQSRSEAAKAMVKERWRRQQARETEQRRQFY